MCLTRRSTRATSALATRICGSDLTRLAEFRAKHIDSIAPNPVDLVQTIRDVPDAKVYKGDVGISHTHMWFRSDTARRVPGKAHRQHRAVPGGPGANDP